MRLNFFLVGLLCFGLLANAGITDLMQSLIEPYNLNINQATQTLGGQTGVLPENSVLNSVNMDVNKLPISTVKIAREGYANRLNKLITRTVFRFLHPPIRGHKLPHVTIGAAAPHTRR